MQEVTVAELLLSRCWARVALVRARPLGFLKIFLTLVKWSFCARQLSCSSFSPTPCLLSLLGNPQKSLDSRWLLSLMFSEILLAFKRPVIRTEIY